jgi:cysteinyl-tRNA synthetase
LRASLRDQKLFELSDKARKVLEDLGFEISDTVNGATWTRR